jgi:hypothetical protein
VTTAYCEADPLTKDFTRRMDHLNHFLTDVRAPAELRTRTREHLRFSKDLVARQTFSDLYQLFSPRLRGDMLVHMSLRTLKTVYYFRECEPDMMRLLAEKLYHYGFERSEKVIHLQPTLNIVTRGTAVRAGRPITLHQYWGEDMIVTSNALRDNRPCMALTYIEIVCLRRQDLFDEVTNFPHSAKVIHVSAMKIAMARASQLIARFLMTKGFNRTQRAAIKIYDPVNAIDEVDQTQSEVRAFDDSLRNLGKNVQMRYREFHGMVRAINGKTPLRGFAREQGGSEDPIMSATAKQALALESSISGSNIASGGRLMLNEDGKTVGSDGRIRSVELEHTDPTLKAIKQVKEDIGEQLEEIRHAVAQLQQITMAGRGRSHHSLCGHTPSSAGGGGGFTPGPSFSMGGHSIGHESEQPPQQPPLQPPLPQQQRFGRRRQRLGEGIEGGMGALEA